MPIILFYGFLILIIAAFSTIVLRKGISFKHIIIGITSIAYSFIYETLFGEYLDLYYYIRPSESILYIILAGTLIYPLLNMIYTIYLPARIDKAVVYTTFWTIAMMGLEYLNVKTGTIVFTGWIPIPWSILTYAFTYTWINIFYRYLKLHSFQ